MMPAIFAMSACSLSGMTTVKGLAMGTCLSVIGASGACALGHGWFRAGIRANLFTGRQAVGVDTLATMLSILDGDVMDAADAHVCILDEGLLRGDGVFEVIRIYAGRPFGLDEHVERMVRSAASIRLALDEAAVRADAATLLDATGDADGALRLVVTRGGRRIGILHPLPVLPATISLATIAYAPTRLLDGVKSLSYGANMLATRLAKEAGADEALLATPHGRVLEGPTTSFFYVLDGALYTPPLADRILDSISRRILMAVTDAQERVTTLDDLAAVSEAFLASSLREVQPVRSIDGREIPSAPGPVSADAASRVREHIEAALAPAA